MWEETDVQNLYEVYEKLKERKYQDEKPNGLED